MERGSAGKQPEGTTASVVATDEGALLFSSFVLENCRPAITENIKEKGKDFK